MPAVRSREIQPAKAKQLLKSFCLIIANEQLDGAPGRPTFQQLERAAAAVEQSRGSWPRATAARWDDYVLAQTAQAEQWQASVLGQNQMALRGRENQRAEDPLLEEVKGLLVLPSLTQTGVQRSSSVELEIGRFLTDLDPAAPLQRPARTVPPEPARHLELDRRMGEAGRAQLMKYLAHLGTRVRWDARRGRRREQRPVTGYLRIVRAAGLKKADAYDASDPFCKVYWNGVEVGATEVQLDAQDPVEFDEQTSTFPVLALPNRPNNTLRITMWDFDDDPDDADPDFMGEVVLSGAGLAALPASSGGGGSTYELEPDLTRGGLIHGLTHSYHDPYNAAVGGKLTLAYDPVDEASPASSSSAAAAGGVPASSAGNGAGAELEQVQNHLSAPPLDFGFCQAGPRLDAAGAEHALQKKRKSCRQWRADDLVASRARPTDEQSFRLVNGKKVSLLKSAGDALATATPLNVPDGLKLNNNAISDISGLAMVRVPKAAKGLSPRPTSRRRRLGPACFPALRASPVPCSVPECGCVCVSPGLSVPARSDVLAVPVHGDVHRAPLARPVVQPAHRPGPRHAQGAAEPRDAAAALQPDRGLGAAAAAGQAPPAARPAVAAEQPDAAARRRQGHDDRPQLLPRARAGRHAVAPGVRLLQRDPQRSRHGPGGRHRRDPAAAAAARPEPVWHVRDAALDDARLDRRQQAAVGLAQHLPRWCRRGHVTL
eukprot:SAG22_NODE_43_length_25304_cov_5.394644_8_plen_715_part_00